MVSKELLEILACPSCKGDLVYDAEKALLICKNGHCSHCGLTVDSNGTCQHSGCGQKNEKLVGLEYRIEDDIPIMLIEEARKFAI